MFFQITAYETIKLAGGLSWEHYCTVFCAESACSQGVIQSEAAVLGLAAPIGAPLLQGRSEVPTKGTTQTEQQYFPTV